MLVILYLLKCLDIKKLIGRQILTCIPDPPKSNMKKTMPILFLACQDQNVWPSIISWEPRLGLDVHLDVNLDKSQPTINYWNLHAYKKVTKS
jgi:hypothetical protein